MPTVCRRQVREMSTPKGELDKLPWLERLNRVVDDEIAAG